eukprot:550156-Karenia_brevis.AAC.1
MAQHNGAILAQGNSVMSFVPRAPLWAFLQPHEKVQLNRTCVICCGERFWDVLQVLLLGRGIDE